MNLLVCNLSAGIMIALTLVIRRFAKNKIPNGVFCLLWFMIGIRLLFPASFRTKISILNIYFHFWNKPVPIEHLKEESFRTSMMEQIETVAALAEGYENILLIVWLIGFSVGAVCFMREYFQVWKKMGKAKPLENAEWLESCILEQKMHRKVLLKSMDNENSPKTWGIFRPVIYFPADFDLGDKELSRMVLLHECGHIKYFHSLFKIWNMFLLCLYWYNPAVWVMFRKFERDLEISADRFALRRSEGDARAEYAQYLIAIATKINKKNCKSEIKYYRWFSHLYKKNSSEFERVEAIMNFKKLGTSAIIATLLIPMGMTSVFATTNTILSENETGRVMNGTADLNIEVIGVELETLDVASPVSIFVEWKDIKSYIVNEGLERASYLVVQNYEYVTYGKLPPERISITTEFEGHTYKGSLDRTDYIYNDATDKYTGFYAGKIYRQ